MNKTIWLVEAEVSNGWWRFFECHSLRSEAREAAANARNLLDCRVRVVPFDRREK